MADTLCGTGCWGVILTPIFEQVAQTGSTNADLFGRIPFGVMEGLWLRADQQDSGRGRQGRQWISPLGNLHASTIIRLGPKDPPPHTLAFTVGLAVRDSLSFFAPILEFRLKWPNDILLNGGKISGMLLECKEDYIVAGIGVNLRYAPEVAGRKTACLAGQVETVPHPQIFLERLAQDVETRLSQWRLGGIKPVLAEWSQYGHQKGDKLTAHLPDGSIIVGFFEQLADDGLLMLLLPDGEIRAIHTGDIFAQDLGKE